MNILLSAIGRIFMSIYFILIAAATIMNWDIAERELGGHLANWEIFTVNIEQLGPIFTALAPMASILLGASIFLQLLGGLLLFFSIRVKFGAFLLLVYMIPATILYHHFWYLEGDAFAKAFVLFLKNLSIIGGLLIILGANIHKQREVVLKKKKKESRPSERRYED